MVQLFFTALPSEARSIIEALGLYKDPGYQPIPLYRNESVLLAVTGVGKIRSAWSVGYVFGRERLGEDVIALNIGVCGGASRSIEIGQCYRINQITDYASGKTVYPDILFKHNLSELPLTTVDKPVLSGGEEFESLVDMEAFGFYTAASQYLKAHRLICLKIVSDHMDGPRLTRTYVSSLIQKNLKSILDVADQYQGRPLPDTRILNREELALLKDLNRYLRLTKTQSIQLERWAVRCKIHNDMVLPRLEEFKQISVNTKHERNMHLEEIRQRLAE